MGIKDTALLDRVQGEVAEIKDDLGLRPEQPVSYEPKAWTRQGQAD